MPFDSTPRMALVLELHAVRRERPRRAGRARRSARRAHSARRRRPAAARRRRCRRSAPAACRPADAAAAVSTSATRKPASFSAGFSRPSTSSPIALSLATISATLASVSRNAFSHVERELHARAPTPPDSVGTSNAREAVVRQPAPVAVEERAQVVHPVFEHRQPIDADAEGEALPLVGVEPGELDARGG